jgi:hypothetical protein
VLFKASAHSFGEGTTNLFGVPGRSAALATVRNLDLAPMNNDMIDHRSDSCSVFVEGCDDVVKLGLWGGLWMVVDPNTGVATRWNALDV